MELIQIQLQSMMILHTTWLKVLSKVTMELFLHMAKLAAENRLPCRNELLPTVGRVRVRGVLE